jgi:hypothetical protein
METLSDPVNSARARLAYFSRRDVGDPTRVPAARRAFEIEKLKRAIRQCEELTADEREQAVSALPAA